MTFDAARDVTIETTADASGTRLCTRGLDRRGRPELEIVEVPGAASRPGSDLLRRIAATSVGSAELRAGERLALLLSLEDDEEARALLVVVRAQARAGRLRTCDPFGDGPPLAALATMMVHEARAHVAMGDEATAIETLRAAIAVLPGEPTAGPPPFEHDEADANAENHCAYLDLATLLGDGHEAREAYRCALERSAGLLLGELGGDPELIAATTRDEASEQVDGIIGVNLETEMPEAQSGGGMVAIASPVWQPLEDGGSVRCVTVLSREHLALYYEGAARAALEGAALADLVVDAFDAHRDRLPDLAWLTRKVRRLYLVRDAPMPFELEGHPADMLLSGLLAEAARCVHGGVDAEELRVHFGLSTDARAAATLPAKLTALDEWEEDVMLRELDFPIDQLKELLARR